MKSFNKQYPVIDRCRLELEEIKIIIDNEVFEKIKCLDPQKKYSQKYLEIAAVILAYSTVETLAKEIIYDFFRIRKTPEVAIDFVKKNIRSTNIDVDSLFQMISSFSDTHKNSVNNTWKTILSFDQYKTQMKSLKELRNTLSHHGQASSYSISDVIEYFSSSVILLYHMHKCFMVI